LQRCACATDFVVVEDSIAGDATMDGQTIDSSPANVQVADSTPCAVWPKDGSREHIKPILLTPLEHELVMKVRERVYSMAFAGLTQSPFVSFVPGRTVLPSVQLGDAPEGVVFIQPYKPTELVRFCLCVLIPAL
jgi:hypothetical protein